MSTTIEIRVDGDSLRVTSPFRPAFTTEAKRIGGKWDATAKQWVFPLRFDAEVRETVRKHYGSTGDEPTVTVEIGPLDDSNAGRAPLTYGDIGYYRDGYKLAGSGRDIAWATGRDSGARIGDGVIVVKGGFGSGGSRKNFTCDMREGTVLRVLDLPLSVAQRLRESHPERVRIIDAEGEAKKGALREEKAKLMARLAEIDAELGEE